MKKLKVLLSVFTVLGLLTVSGAAQALEGSPRLETAREIWSDSSSLIIARYYFETQPQLTAQQRSEIETYLMKSILNNADFSAHPEAFLTNLKEARGHGKSLVFPQDAVIDFLTSLKKKNQLQDYANESKHNNFAYYKK